MITEKQRRSALARAKFERQQAKRTAAQERARTWSIIGGTVAAVVLVLFVGWGIHYLVSNDSNTPTTPVFPSNTLTMKTPTNTSFATSFSPRSTTGTSTGTTTGRTEATTGTTTRPVTTGATSKANP